MMNQSRNLEGKKALIVGVANERSLAWAIAQCLKRDGAELGFTFLGESLERRVRPLAESVGARLIEPCDVADDDQIENLFAKARDVWGSFDILIHSVAFADRADLEGRFVSTSRKGFHLAMDISVYSLMALASKAEPLMVGSSCPSILTLSYYGAEKVVPNYNIMGVAKAALESAMRYLAWDMGRHHKIRVNSISAGPVKTLAAAGIRDLRSMIETAGEKTPLRENISSLDVGELAAFLSSPAAKHITGANFYVDSGANIMGV